MLSFLLRMWLTGWLWARMAPYVLVALLIFALVLQLLVNTIAHQFGVDKWLRVKNGQVQIINPHDPSQR
jgi:hypothetical protein